MQPLAHLLEMAPVGFVKSKTGASHLVEEMAATMIVPRLLTPLAAGIGYGRVTDHTCIDILAGVAGLQILGDILLLRRSQCR